MATQPSMERLPLGVYVNHQRETAVAFKRAPDGVWFLRLHSGRVELLHYGDTRFFSEYSTPLTNYPILRAVRKYNDSPFLRDARTQKVMTILLRS